MFQIDFRKRCSSFVAVTEVDPTYALVIIGLAVSD